MTVRLGVSVGTDTVHALGVRHGRIAWAAHAAFAGLPDLTEVLARIASEGPMRGRRARVVLTRPLVQFRTLMPGPPLRGRSAARRYVELHADRLFRRNGSLLLTDGYLVRSDKGRGLLAAATSAVLAGAILEGCDQAGVRLEALGPASELIHQVLRAPPRSGEVTVPHPGAREILTSDRHMLVRTRLVREMPAEQQPLLPSLDGLGAEAWGYAPALAAALRSPALSLLPSETQAVRRRATRRRSQLIAGMALGLWMVAGTVLGLRTAERARELRAESEARRPAVDSVLAVRGQLNATRAALAVLDTGWVRRGQPLRTLVRLTEGLDDGTVVVALRLTGDSAVRLAAYGGSASRTLAQLEQVRMLGDVHLESVPARETIGSGSLRREVERLAVVARVREGS